LVSGGPFGFEGAQELASRAQLVGLVVGVDERAATRAPIPHAGPFGVHFPRYPPARRYAILAGRRLA
jgi:hypothetical protein